MSKDSEKQSAPNKPWLKQLSQVFRPKAKNQQQLTELLIDAKNHQLLEPETFDMIEGVLQVSHTQVREAMIPRPQMVTVAGHLTPEEVIPQIIKAGHSRFPVTDEHDKVIGILLAKDLLRFSLSEQTATATTVKTLIRPAIFVPEGKRLNIQLREFRLNRNHMAIVVDEYGEVSGLITIEDVLEEIVGEIADEYDSATEAWVKKLNDKEYTIKALMPIDEFNDYFKSQLQHEDFDTIGGIMLQHLSHFPKRGESVTIDNFTFTVIEASRRGIHLLRLTKLD